MSKNKAEHFQSVSKNDTGARGIAQSKDALSESKSQQTYIGFKLQAIVLALIAFAFYCNTFTNGWAFDDNLVIVQNEYVHQGFAGIPRLLTGDAFESAANSQNAIGTQLSGGRYRPLSIITFAIEEQILGVDVNYAQNTDAEAKKAKLERLESYMHVRHGVNVLLYVLSVVVLLYFLREVIFPNHPLAAFFAAFIFTIHPIHTEVVANVKSRDELLSLLFISLTFITSFKYRVSRKNSDLAKAMICFFLALLSKEYAVTMVVLLPLSFYWLKSEPLIKSVKSSLIYLVPLGLYIMLRFSSVKGASESVENDVMDNCYLLATGVERIATIIYVPLNYLKLLFFPHPLAADYSFNQIPYTNFSDIRVWLSLLIHVGLITLAIYSFLNKKVLGFGIAFYLAFLLLVSNIFINIGAPMGERLIYHSSVGFAICVGYLLDLSYQKISSENTAKILTVGLLSVLLVVSGFKTITRNSDWKSDDTLFTKDILKSPNSVIVNNNAGFAYIKRANDKQGAEKTQLLQQALPYLNKAIAINSRYIMSYLNRGVCYFRLGETEKAHSDCDTIIKYYPLLPALSALSVPLSTYYTKEGIKYGTNNEDSTAILFFRKAADVAPFDARIQCNLGMQLVKDKRYEEAKPIIMRVLELQPNDEQAMGLLQMIESGN